VGPLAPGPDGSPHPPPPRLDHLRENAAAAILALGADVLARLDAVVNPRTVSGPRYNATTQQEIDTEEIVLPG
jgi:hypothetical protein